MPERARTVAIAVAVVALGVLATGCNPSPGPSLTPSTGATSSTPEPTTTTRTTPSASPTTDPGIPAEAQVDSIDGAEAFVKYFIQQSNRSWTEPNSTLLGPLCLPESKSCQSLIGTAQDYEAKGWKYVGVPFEPSVVFGRSWSNGQATVVARGSQAPGTVVDSSGVVSEAVPASSGGLVFQLDLTGSWRVREIKTEAGPT